ncbi:MAG: (Fe-S)-binding protein [Halobacteriota archaeon]|nr:(Fe-S)-binding protein [Halobacteriota archaeon]
MSFEKYEKEFSHCLHCHLCYVANWHTIDGWMPICPTAAYFRFESFYATGRIEIARGIFEDKITEPSERLLTAIYSCTGCGACREQCHSLTGFKADHLELFGDLKSKYVEEGELLPEHMAIMDGLKREDNVFGKPKADRGRWAEGLDIKDINKEKADVIYHAGCRLSYDEELWPIARGAITLLKDAGVDVGIAGSEESCCGGRIYEMGYKGEAKNYAEDVSGRVKASGATKLVTSCSDGYRAFKELYAEIGHELDVKVLHITQYLYQLIREGKIKPQKEVPMRVTYHDPCHLGRISGVYNAPRNILNLIPGIELIEMRRSKENSLCCGSGAGVMETFSDFSQWTAKERIEEAMSTGAEAIVTACPWCERAFKDAVNEMEEDFGVYDVLEILMKAI